MAELQLQEGHLERKILLRVHISPVSRPESLLNVLELKRVLRSHQSA